MIPNINQITAKLATLDDNALQQYAQMHQEDPYILALSVSEKNRRAALRNSATAQQGAKPTVAQQEIAEMQPAGIALLPTPALDETADVEMAAGGGIIGYAGGGDVWWEKELENIHAAPVEGPAQLSRMLDYLNYNEDAERAKKRFAEEQQQKVLLQEAAAAQNRTALNAADAGIRALPLETKTAVKAPPAEPPINREAPTQEGIRGALPDGAASAASTATAAPVAGAQPAAAPVATSATAANDPGGLRALYEDSEKRQAALEEQRQARLKAYYDNLTKDAATDVTEFEERKKREAEPYDEKRSRITAREQELEKQQKSARAYAIIRAGLAMMSGESPYALVNIGRGAQEGLNQYAVDTQRIDKAREGLREELDKIADLQAQARLATGEKLAELRKRQRAVQREGEFKAIELAEASGLERAKEQGKTLFAGLVNIETKKLTAAIESKYRQQELAIQGRNSIAAAAAGRSGANDSKADTLSARITKDALDAAQKDPRWLVAKTPADRQMVFNDYVELYRKQVPGYGESAFVAKPGAGDTIRR